MPPAPHNRDQRRGWIGDELRQLGKFCRAPHKVGHGPREIMRNGLWIALGCAGGRGFGPLATLNLLKEFGRIQAGGHAHLFVQDLHTALIVSQRAVRLPISCQQLHQQLMSLLA